MGGVFAAPLSLAATKAAESTSTAIAQRIVWVSSAKLDLAWKGPWSCFKNAGTVRDRRANANAETPTALCGGFHESERTTSNFCDFPHRQEASQTPASLDHRAAVWTKRCALPNTDPRQTRSPLLSLPECLPP